MCDVFTLRVRAPDGFGKAIHRRCLATACQNRWCCANGEFSTLCLTFLVIPEVVSRSPAVYPTAC